MSFDAELDLSRHVSHFATCPDAGKWRKLALQDVVRVTRRA